MHPLPFVLTITMPDVPLHPHAEIQKTDDDGQYSLGGGQCGYKFLTGFGLVFLVC